MTTSLLADHDSIFIGGQWVTAATSDRLDIVSPVTEQPIASVPSASREDIDRAVLAARAALETGPWPAMTLDDRMAMLKRLRELLVKHSEELAHLITDEMGCPITQSRAIQVVNPLRVLDAYLDAAATYPFRSVRRTEVTSALVLRE